MRERDLKELAALQMRICAKLNETLGLSQELAEAVERQDQVSVKLLLSSRQKPILELHCFACMFSIDANQNQITYKYTEQGTKNRRNNRLRSVFFRNGQKFRFAVGS